MVYDFDGLIIRLRLVVLQVRDSAVVKGCLDFLVSLGGYGCDCVMCITGVFLRL